MKRILILVTLLATLSAPVLAERHNHKGHSHQVKAKQTHRVAKAVTYRAVCSRGDLNRSFPTRAGAIRAARAHQRATKHSTSVRKQ